MKNMYASSCLPLEVLVQILYLWHARSLLAFVHLCIWPDYETPYLTVMTQNVSSYINCTTEFLYILAIIEESLAIVSSAPFAIVVDLHTVMLSC